MRRGGYEAGDRTASELPPPSVPDLLAPPAGPGPQGWECPRCHRVYAPWVACCGTCGPETAAGRTEITEGG